MTRKVTTASEREIGKLHAKVYKIYGMTLDAMIQKLESGEDPAFIVDSKILMAVQKFLTDNKVYSIPDSEDEGSDLSKRLAEIKNSVGFKLVVGD